MDDLEIPGGDLKNSNESSNFFSTSSGGSPLADPPCSISWSGRAHFGAGFLHNDAIKGYVTGGSWLQTQGAGSSTLSYIEDQARVSIVNDAGDGSIALSAASRATRNPIAFSSIAVAPQTSDRTSYTFTATSAQTVFSVADNGDVLRYAAGHETVTQNGTPLTAGVDYTRTSLISITLASGATAGDTIVITAPIPIKAWSQYNEVIKDGFTSHEGMGMEMNIVNLVNDAAEVEKLTPYGGIPRGHIGGFSIASGGDVMVNPTTYPANHALRISNNGNTFRSGIVFMNNALEGAASPVAGEAIEYAILLGGRHAIVGYDATGAEKTAIWTDNSGDLRIASDDFQIKPNGENYTLFAQQEDATPVHFNRDGTDGSIVAFEKNGSVVGSISITSSAVAYNTTSDSRLKSNIADAAELGTTIDDIKIRQFDWSANGEHTDYGLIAQELVSVCPAAVFEGDEESYWAVDPAKLVPMLVKAIQELRARVTALEA